MRIVAAGGADITITSPLQAAGADGQTNSTSGIPTYDLASGFNGTTWDRLRALGDDSDGVASASLGRLVALARLSGYNGATWDRLLSEGNDRDAITNTTLGNLQTLGFAHGYNGATWDRLLSEGNDRDAIANTTLGNLQTLGFPHVYNGATWDRQRAFGDTSLEGLGVASTSQAVPGASAVIQARGEMLNSNTRIPIATPTSGKRCRVIAATWRGTGSISVLPALYFGTGATVETTPGKVIFEVGATLMTGVGAYVQGGNIVFGDGCGPVGAVDDVISMNCVNSANTEIAMNVYYREE